MMEKKFDCLVCGTTVVDAIVKPVPLEDPIGKGGLLHVGPLTVTTGGLVCNTGIAMQRLGLKVSAAGLVGQDIWIDSDSFALPGTLNYRLQKLLLYAPFLSL